MAAVEVIFPQLGMGELEGEVVEWLVPVGATVTRGQTVAVIETGKSSVEIEATADGTIEAIVAGVGSTVEVGDVIGLIKSV
jgi:pyruvate dehydrogenase E2 component (dihydrolipoamide acetyltransferase)